MTRGQGLILIERWFAHLWGLNDWFWRFFFFFLKCLWRFVHEEVFPWRFFIVSIFRDSHCEEFLFWETFCGFFFFEMFSLRLFCCEDLFNCSSLRLKNCFNLLVLRLKIFVLVIWHSVIGSGSDFKIATNSGLELGILIDSGSDLKFEMIFRLWLFIWVGFLHNWVDFVVS